MMHGQKNIKLFFLSYLTQFFLECEMFQIKLLDKIKTQFPCSKTFFFKNRVAYEIMWRIIVDSGRPQMTIWRMRIACCIPKSKNTLRICNTYCFSPATMVARMRLIVTLCTHGLSYYVCKISANKS